MVWLTKTRVKLNEKKLAEEVYSMFIHKYSQSLRSFVIFTYYHNLHENINTRELVDYKILIALSYLFIKKGRKHVLF